MITKNKYIALAVFTLLVGGQLCAAEPNDEPRPVGFGIQVGRFLVSHRVEEIANGDLGCLGLGAGVALAIHQKDNSLVLAGLGAATLAYHVPVFVHWWNLGNDLKFLKAENATGPLVKRNKWGYNSELATARQIMDHYNRLGEGAPKLEFAQLLARQVQKGNTISRALKALEGNLTCYEKYSSVLLAIAQEALPHSENPQEDLLQGTYLLENDIDNLQYIVNRHTAGSKIAQTFSLSWRWSSFWKSSIPAWYTWSQKIASECIWETLQQYARLRVIQSIIENNARGDRSLRVIIARDIEPEQVD